MSRTVNERADMDLMFKIFGITYEMIGVILVAVGVVRWISERIIKGQNRINEVTSIMNGRSGKVKEHSYAGNSVAIKNNSMNVKLNSSGTVDMESGILGTFIAGLVATLVGVLLIF